MRRVESAGNHRRPAPAIPTGARRRTAGRPIQPGTGDFSGNTGVSPARSTGAAGAPTGDPGQPSPVTTRAGAPVPPVLPSNPVLTARLADYWNRQDQRARVGWFELAGFRVAYSATTWLALTKLVPEMAAAIAETIVAEDFPPVVPR